ncbi:MAG: hypothetical protein LZ173_10515 [Thaumarchaeota archaeon]|jgi:hypothetical protein|nr:hypothetical protein [Candidatus Geocrenenecus arthurdayi]
MKAKLFGKKDNAVGIGGFIEIEVIDKDGKVIERAREPMHSLTNNMAHWLDIFRLGTINGRDTSGNDISNVSLSSVTNVSVLAPSGNDNYGIIIGSSNTSFSIFQYNLQSKYPNSSFSHGETAVDSISQSPLYSCTTYKRTFTNNTSGDLVVREVGLVAMLQTGSTTRYMLLTRDVISDRTIPAGGSIVVKIGIYINQPPPS